MSRLLATVLAFAAFPLMATPFMRYSPIINYNVLGQPVKSCIMIKEKLGSKLKHVCQPTHYNSAGQVNDGTDYLGNKTVNTYYASNTLATQAIYNPQGRKTQELNYQYDLPSQSHGASPPSFYTGEVTQVSNNTSTVSYHYYANGDIQQSIRYQSATHNKVISTTLNNENALSSYTDIGNVVHNIKYYPLAASDTANVDAGRLWQENVTLPNQAKPLATRTYSYSHYAGTAQSAHALSNGAIATISYFDTGPITKNGFHNSSVAYGYNALGNVHTIRYQKGNPSQPVETVTKSYTPYQAIGTLTYKSPLNPKDKNANTRNTYQYNALDQLTGMTNGLPTVAMTPPDVTYHYNADGDLLTVTSAKPNIIPSANYHYNNLDQVTQATLGAHTTTYAYNNNGSLTDDSSGNQYSYNALNQMTGYTNPQAVQTNYTYYPDE